MTTYNVWLDAHLSPALAAYINRTFDGVIASSLYALGLRDAADVDIFNAARDAGVIFLTKDSDFLLMLDRSGPPPQVLWITCGNTTTAKMRDLMDRQLRAALALFEAGEALVELSGA